MSSVNAAPVAVTQPLMPSHHTHLSPLADSVSHVDRPWWLALSLLVCVFALTVMSACQVAFPSTLAWLSFPIGVIPGVAMLLASAFYKWDTHARLRGFCAMLPILWQAAFTQNSSATVAAAQPTALVCFFIVMCYFYGAVPRRGWCSLPSMWRHSACASLCMVCIPLQQEQIMPTFLASMYTQEVFRATSAATSSTSVGTKNGIAVLRPLAGTLAALQFVSLLVNNKTGQDAQAVFRMYLDEGGAQQAYSLWVVSWLGWGTLALHMMAVPLLSPMPSIVSVRPDQVRVATTGALTCANRLRTISNKWHPAVAFALVAQVATIGVLLVHFATGDFDTFVCYCFPIENTGCIWKESSVGGAVSLVLLGIVIMGAFSTLRLYMWLAPRMSWCGRVASRCECVTAKLAVDARLHDVVALKTLAVMAKIMLLSHTSLAGAQQTYFVLFVILNVMNLFALLSLKMVAFRDVWRLRGAVEIPSLDITVHPRRLVLVFLSSTVVGKLAAVLGMVLAGVVSNANGAGVSGVACAEAAQRTANQAVSSSLIGCVFAVAGSTVFSNEAAHMLDWVRHVKQFPANGRVRIHGNPVPGAGSLSHFYTARWLLVTSCCVLLAFTPFFVGNINQLHGLPVVVIGVAMLDLAMLACAAVSSVVVSQGLGTVHRAPVVAAYASAVIVAILLGASFLVLTR